MKKSMYLFLIVATLIMLTANAFSFPFLREEGPVFIVEIQNRPFSIPTDWITPHMLSQVESITDDYAIFVWSKVGSNIVEVFSDNDLGFLMDTYKSSVFSRVNRVLLDLEVGKSKIENGRVVALLQ